MKELVIILVGIGFSIYVSYLSVMAIRAVITPVQPTIEEKVLSDGKTKCAYIVPGPFRGSGLSCDWKE